LTPVQQDNDIEQIDCFLSPLFNWFGYNYQYIILADSEYFWGFNKISTSVLFSFDSRCYHV